MSTAFDGANDSIVCSPGAASVGLPTADVTQVSLIRIDTGASWRAAGLSFRQNSTTTRYGWELDNGVPHGVRVGNDATTQGVAAAQVDVGDNWCCVGSAHHNTGVALLAVGKQIGGSTTWASGNTPSLGLTQGSVQDILFGEWGGNVDDHSGWIAVQAWFDILLTLAQIQECVAGLRTSDFWNNSAGRPKGLWEFNGTSLVDLTGNGANETSRNGTTTGVANDPAGWNYNGTGAAKQTRSPRRSTTAVQRASTWCKKRNGIFVPDLWLPTPARP